MAGKYDKERAAMGLPPLSSSKRDYSSFGKYAYARQRLDEGAGIQSRFMSPEGRAFATSTLSSTPDPMASMETMVGRPAKESANARGLVVDSLSRPISALDSLKNLPKAEPELKPLISGETYMAPVGAIKTGELTEKQQKEADKRTRQALRTGVGRSIAERVLEYPAEGLERFVDAATFGLVSRNNLNVPEREDYERSLAGTVGEFAGYVAPGVAIERAAASALRPAIGGLSRTSQRAITGGVAGTAEVAAQEAGDVLFRGESFDPENIALGAGIGAGANVAIPAAIEGIKRGVGALRSRLGRAGTQSATQAAEEATEGVAQPFRSSASREVTQPEATGIRARLEPDPGDVEQVVESFQPQSMPITPGQTVDETFKQTWFQRLFGEQQIGFTPFGSSKSNRIVTPEQQIVSNPLRREASELTQSLKQASRVGYQNFVDFLSPLKRISPEVYDTAMDASRAKSVTNAIVWDKIVDLEGNVLGSSLNDMMKMSRGLGKKLDSYLILRHAPTRMRRGERVFDPQLKMTPEKAEQMARTLEQRYPQLRQIAQMWDQYNTIIPEVFGVREGLISREAFEAMKQANPHYAPMRRQFSLGEKLAQPKFKGTGSSFSGQSAPLHRVSETGSVRKIVSPIRSAIEQTYGWVNAALRNRTIQSLIQAIQRDPEGMRHIAEIIKTPSTSKKSLQQALREGGSEEFIEMLENDFRNLFKQGKAGDDRIVRGMVNGQEVYVKVNDIEAVKALIGMGHEQAGIVLQAAQMLSNATKRGATGLLAPMFSVKSLIADTAQAAIQSNNPVRHVLVDVPYALISTLADVLRIPGLRDLAQEFRRVGGEYSALLRSDRQLNDAVWRMRRQPFLTPEGMAKGLYYTIRAPFKALEEVADRSENLNRLAAYRRAMKGKERTPENIRAALNEARESTVNWSRRGLMAQEMESFFPYNNAAIQGMYRLVKQLSDPRKAMKTFAGLTTLVIMPKLAEYAMFHDDPDYQALPARERYRHIIYGKNKDGTFRKVFMPPEYNAIGALMTDIIDDVSGNDPAAFKGVMDALADVWLPPPVSGALQGVTQGEEGDTGALEKSMVGLANASILSPYAAVAMNQSFTGAPIVPLRLQGYSPEFQYDERTSEVAKQIGQRIGMAPMKVDYLLRSYGGDPARLVLPLTSDAGAGTPRNTLLRNFIVDPVFTNTLSNDFYAAKDAFEKAKNDYDNFGKPLPEWFDQRAYRMLNSRSQGSPATKLSHLNAKKREINGSDLPAKEKTEKLREVQAQINQIYTDVNSYLLELGFPFPNR